MKKYLLKKFSLIIGLFAIIFATTQSTFWVYKPETPKSLLK